MPSDVYQPYEVAEKKSRKAQTSSNIFRKWGHRKPILNRQRDAGKPLFCILAYELSRILVRRLTGN